MISAIGQPFLTNAPAKVSALWFSDKGRVIATTIATVANPLGVAVGFLIPAIFVDDDDAKVKNRLLAKSHILNSLICQAIIGSVVCLLVLIFFREKPPTPPSPSAGIMSNSAIH